ncbi:MAG TPA: poly(R)-hydroxyalkanoic acid synthase subunit PhaE [Thermoanaerobaculia bacterium]|nr:poly(R)-hydroxyalkanoic acid synthase subunit PhaE [Thermoanaerobaculia bacterium]
MSDEPKKTPSWLDPLGLNPELAELGLASGKVMEAWSKAYRTALSERTLPAMELFNPATWARTEGHGVSEALEQALGTPEWSDALSLDSETLKKFAPATELVQLSQEYAVAVARVSAEICQTFQKRLASPDEKDDDAGEAIDLWNATVDETLMAFNRSETFADLQRRYVRALMAFRLEQRWLASRMAEPLGMPTRDEVDELARRVHDLERENRRLRRAIDAKPRSGKK